MGIYLTKPNKEKHSQSGSADTLRFGLSSMQGWRTTMEDAHIAAVNLKENVHVFGVFDGHGGVEVALFCAENFLTQLKKNPKFDAGKYKEALEETFMRMDEMLSTPEGEKRLKALKKESESKGNSFAGCTANVCIVTKEEVYCANAGDARSILFGSDGVLSLSTDHKPDLEKERARIVAAGGYVSEGRVNDNLNLSRAIGDLEFKKNPALKPESQIISAFPDVTITKIDKKYKFLLMGCDGIWEMLPAKEICEKATMRLAKEENVAKVVEDLLDQMIAKDTVSGIGCDNMTCILVVFK